MCSLFSVQPPGGDVAGIPHSPRASPSSLVSAGERLTRLRNAVACAVQTTWRKCSLRSRFPAGSPRGPRLLTSSWQKRPGKERLMDSRQRRAGERNWRQREASLKLANTSCSLASSDPTWAAQVVTTGVTSWLFGSTVSKGLSFNNIWSFVRRPV